jgi:hypothetical protein
MDLWLTRFPKINVLIFVGQVIYRQFTCLYSLYFSFCMPFFSFPPFSLIAFLLSPFYLYPLLKRHLHSTKLPSFFYYFCHPRLLLAYFTHSLFHTSNKVHLGVLSPPPFSPYWRYWVPFSRKGTETKPEETFQYEDFSHVPLHVIFFDKFIIPDEIKIKVQLSVNYCVKTSVLPWN